jgi:TolA-binding protein
MPQKIEQREQRDASPQRSNPPSLCATGDQIMRAYLSLGVALLLLGASSPSFVEAKSYRELRKKRGMELKGSKRSYEIEEVKKTTPKTTDENTKRGPMKLEVFDRFDKERLQEKTSEQIKTLRELINQTPQEERADLYFRLGEHYWENSQYFDHVGHRYDDFRNKPDWPEKKRLQAQAWSQAKEYRKKAATEYFNIIKNYPKFPRLCEAYFFLGKNLIEMGEPQKGLDVYRGMLKRFGRSYPKCPFIPNAYLAFGEYYFEKGQVKTAKGSYETVLRFRDTSVYGFALYKIAWCEYNLVQYQASLNQFIAVIRYARDEAGYKGGNSRRLALLREATRDMVLAYSKAGNPEEAERRFLEIGGEDYYIKMLENLGGIYQTQGKTGAIITIYQALMRLKANSPRTIRYQLYITRATDIDQGKQATIRESKKLGEMIKDFEKKAASSENKEFKQEYADALGDAKPQLKEYAKYRHYEAQKARRADFYNEAKEFYKIYLDVFPKDKDAYEMRFWLGEIHYRAREFEEAAKHYKIVYNENPKGKYSFDASYNTILAYDFLMKRANINPANLTAKKGVQTKKDLPPIAKDFLAACEDHIRYYPKGERALEVSYKAALLYYYFNHFDNALPRFYFLVEKHPKHEYAIFSAHFILDTYQLQEKWDNLNKGAWKFYKTAELGDAKFKGEMRDLIIGSGMKICERIMQAKQHKEAAECFLNIAKEFPNNKKLGPTALFNASVNYGNAKEPEKALRLRHEMLERYPGSSFEKDTILGLADLYAGRADFQQAAKFYERYAEKYGKKDPKIDEIIIQAAIFREAMGDTTGSMAHYNRLLREYQGRIKKRQLAKDDKRFVTIFKKIAEFEKKNGQFARYAKMMKEFDKERYGTSGQRLHARMEYARTRKRLGFRTESEKEFKAIPGAYSRLDKDGKDYLNARDAASEVRFMKAEELFKEYTKLTLKKGLTKTAMAQALKGKVAALQKTRASFEDVVKYNHPYWRVASLFRVGELYLDYSKFLQSAPTPNVDDDVKKTVMKNLLDRLKENKVPYNMRATLARKFLNGPQGRELLANLKDKVKMKYEDDIRQSAIPYEKEAVKLYERALRISHRTGLYNEWTFRALARLQELDPARYHKFVEIRPEAGIAGSDFRFSNNLM